VVTGNVEQILLVLNEQSPGCSWAGLLQPASDTITSLLAPDTLFSQIFGVHRWLQQSSLGISPFAALWLLPSFSV